MLPEGFDDEIVHLRAQLEAAAPGHEMQPVREHHDHRLLLQIDPERGAGEAEVPHRSSREVAARRRHALGRGVPAEGPVRGLGQMLP